MPNFKKDIRKLAKAKDELPVFDGSINPDLYAVAPIKILWVLKDLPSLDKKQRFELKDKIATISTDLNIRQGFKNTFSKIAEVSAAIINRLDKHVVNHNPDTNKLKALDHIAVISIKKFSDGKKASHTELLAYYQEAKKLLHHQIETLNPDVILFINSYSYFQNDLNLNLLNSFGTCQATAKTNKIYINLNNPANNIHNEAYVNDVLQAYQAFKRQLDRIEEKTYSEQSYQSDVKELKQQLESTLNKTKHIEAELLKVNNYERLAELKSFKKGLCKVIKELNSSCN